MADNLGFAIRIEIPQGNTGVYEPAGADAVRLTGTWFTGDPLPANWATALGTLTAAGESLGAWVISSVPIAPASVVQAQAIGLLSWHAAGETRHVVVATPEVDQGMVRIRDWRDLSEELRRELEAGIGPGHRLAWEAPFEAVQVIRQARRMARLAQVDADHQRATPIWRATAGPGGFREFEGTPHTLAEMELRQLPVRYQEYIADMLADDERILLYVPRPMFHQDGQGMLRRAQRHNAGLLVVTDQQVLWMTDALPPIEILKSYGYVAKSCVLERIKRVEVHEDTRLAHLRLELGSPAGGAESFAVPFPAASVGLLRRVVAYVEAFLSGRRRDALMRLARLPATETPLTDLVETNDEKTQRLLPAWEHRLEAMLGGDETVAAQAIVPAWTTDVPLLLAVTDQRVLRFGVDTPEPTVFLLSHITSADLSHSVMESWLRLWVADGEGVKPVQFDFPLVALGPFTRAYVALRRGLLAPAAFRVAEREVIIA